MSLYVPWERDGKFIGYGFLWPRPAGKDGVLAWVHVNRLFVQWLMLAAVALPFVLRKGNPVNILHDLLFPRGMDGQ